MGEKKRNPGGMLRTGIQLGKRQAMGVQLPESRWRMQTLREERWLVLLSHFFTIFIMKGCWVFSKAFSASVKMTMIV